MANKRWIRLNSKFQHIHFVITTVLPKANKNFAHWEIFLIVYVIMQSMPTALDFLSKMNKRQKMVWNENNSLFFFTFSIEIEKYLIWYFIIFDNHDSCGFDRHESHYHQHWCLSLLPYTIVVRFIFFYFSIFFFSKFNWFSIFFFIRTFSFYVNTTVFSFNSVPCRLLFPMYTQHFHCV